MVQSIRSLQIFIAVAEELHFRKAAERLHMTQPPLSLQIKKLEEAIGVDLFSRTTRSVQLTPAGKEFQIRATRFLTELEDMKEAVRDVANGTVGALSLGFNSSTMFELLPQLLEVQRTRYPKVSLHLQELSSAEQLELLRARKLDAALARATPAMLGADLDCIVAAQEALLVALPMDHPLARLESVPIQALHKARYIGFSASRARYFRDLTESLFKQHDIEPEQVQESVLPTILALVEARLGITIVPESSARLRTQSLTYRPLSGIDDASPIPIYFIWRKSDVPASVKNFIKIIEQCRPSETVELLARRLSCGRPSETTTLSATAPT